MSFVPTYILILGFTIIIDYFAGIFIEKVQGRQRKFFLIISLITNVGILAFFKYYNFANETLTLFLSKIHLNNNLPYLTILLPIGLSFHTFQAMSYTIEVFRGNQKAERNFGVYSLYVLFYPQLVAGPIERPQNLLYQFKKKHQFQYQRIADGLKLMAWGLFKKVVIADRLSIVVNNVYDSPHKFHGISFIVATIFFSFQIFCDFSGYTDIAIGAAKVMGFKLMRNFNRPYHSRSISEFWARWHISLSTWFKDYLYIPLGGSRVSVPRWYFNLFFVFLVSGLWHGANWTYILWGALNGFYLVFALFTQKIRNNIITAVGINKFPKMYYIIQVFTTYCLILIAWVFFRAHTVYDAIYVIKSAYSETYPDIVKLIHNMPLQTIATHYDFQKGVIAILFLEIIHILQTKINIIDYINSKPKFIRWSIYYLFIFLLLFSSTSTNSQFIYFQF